MTYNDSLRNIIEKDLIKIIKGLSSADLINIYRDLSGLKIVATLIYKSEKKTVHQKKI